MKILPNRLVRNVLAIIIVSALAHTTYTTKTGLFGVSKVEAGTANPVSGYAWSETIGWISFSCANDSSCATSPYGVTVDSDTGYFSGNAWSENIGWISFDRASTSNPPAAPFDSGVGPIAQVDWSTGNVTGWARALSACQDSLVDGLGNCTGSGAGDAAGGWDGWIRLSDETDPSWAGNGVKILADKFSGYAWSGNSTEIAANIQIFAADSPDLGSPNDLIFDNVGNLYVSNEWSNTVSKIAPDGVITTINLVPSGCSGPSALTFGPLGNAGDLYVACYSSRTVSKITPAGSASLFASLAPSGGLYPADIVFNPINGNFYTANSTTISASSNVSQITQTGTVTLFANTSTIGTLPKAIVVDTVGNLYVAYYGGNKIAKITLAGTPSMFVNLAPGGVGSFGPFALAFDNAGNLYSVNYGSTDISKITFSSPGVLLGVSQFSDFSGLSWGPKSFTFDATRTNLYVANYDIPDIVKVDSVGNASIYATLPGDPTPRAIALDTAGNVYTADMWAYGPLYGNVSKITSGITTSDSGVTGWIDFAPVIAGLNIVHMVSAPIPTFNFYSDPSSVSNNGTTVIHWNGITDATSCTPSGGSTGWSGVSIGIGGGSWTTGTLIAADSPYTFVLNCTGPGGSVPKIETVTVAAPICNSDAVCGAGETVLNCPDDCKAKVIQF